MKITNIKGFAKTFLMEWGLTLPVWGLTFSLADLLPRSKKPQLELPTHSCSSHSIKIRVVMVIPIFG